MSLSEMYVEILEVLKPSLVLSGFLSLTISVIVMLINMMIDAFTGRGLHIGSK